MPKLSIITVNFNNASGLKKTIRSVVNQIYKDLEYIVIDGGSIDDSMDVIKAFSNKISYWLSEPDKGIYNAMNKGIIKARGEFLLFLNSGDYLFDEEVLTNVFDQNLEPYDIITGNYFQLFPSGKRILARMPDFIDAKYLYNSFLSHPSTFIKKSLFLKHGLYDESYQITGDHAFFVKIFLMDTIEYTHIDIIISNYTMDGISSNPKSIESIKLERLRAFKEQLPPEYFYLIEKYCTRNRIAYFISRVIRKLKSISDISRN